MMNRKGFFILKIKIMSIKGKLRGLEDEQLEIFVRQRLGQDDVVFREHLEDHMRLSFHSKEIDQMINNAMIMSSFNDVWGTEDDMDTPVASGHKGTITIKSKFPCFDEEKKYNGEGTIEIMVQLIKTFLDYKFRI